MKNLILGLVIVLGSLTASANSGPGPRYEERQDQRSGYSYGRVSSYSYGQSTYTYNRPAPRPSCSQRCSPRPPAQPVLDCRVIMLDACDRQIYSYNGAADRPSGVCSGALRQCNRDIQREGQYDARCIQVRRY